MSEKLNPVVYDKQLICQCCLCKNYSIVSVHQTDFDAWQNTGKFVQDAFPYLSKGDRELLISKTCNKCWQDMFGGMGADDDEDEE